MVHQPAARYPETMSPLYRAVFVDRWPFWVGGVAIAAVALLLLLTAGKPLGVSTGFEDACSALTSREARRSWRLPFLAGIVAGGAVAALCAGASPTLAMGAFDRLMGAALPIKALAFTAGGVLIGFGTRLADGCTSGHGILGVAQRAPASLLATASFMASGFAVTQLLVRALGGG
jgi:uncharacterized protein